MPESGNGIIPDIISNWLLRALLVDMGYLILWN
jgi:hypothetical protein